MQERDHLNEDDFPLFYCVKKNDIQVQCLPLHVSFGNMLLMNSFYAPCSMSHVPYRC